MYSDRDSVKGRGFFPTLGRLVLWTLLLLVGIAWAFFAVDTLAKLVFGTGLDAFLAWVGEPFKTDPDDSWWRRGWEIVSKNFFRSWKLIAGMLGGFLSILLGALGPFGAIGIFGHLIDSADRGDKEHLTRFEVVIFKIFIALIGIFVILCLAWWVRYDWRGFLVGVYFIVACGTVGKILDESANEGSSPMGGCLFAFVIFFLTGLFEKVLHWIAG